jgi:hypothetical protein
LFEAYLCVLHCGGNALVLELSLHSGNVSAVFNHPGCCCMPDAMRPYTVFYIGFFSVLFVSMAENFYV